MKQNIMNSKTRYNVLHTLGLAALIFLALLIVTNQIYNYLQFRKTVVQKTEAAKSFPFPSISFCPGFNSNLDEDFPWLLPRNQLDLFRKVENFPRTKTAAKKLWKESTFDIRDFLRYTEITYANETTVTLNLGKEGDCFDIKQLDTVSGKCYTFTLTCSFSIKVDYWTLAFDLDKVNRSDIFLYLHERNEAAVFGLNMNFWYLSTTGKTVASKSIVDMPLRKIIHQYTTGVDIEDYVKCEQETFAKNLNLSKACWAPMFDASLSYATLGANHNFRPCRTYQGFAATFFQISAAMNALGAEQGNACTRPRTEVAFETDLRQNMAPVMGFSDKSGMTSICIYYDSREVHIQEEFVLMDMSSLTSSIGGVIGAILGWSILDFVNFCLRHFYS